MSRKKLFRRILYLILFILIINFLANKFYWYSSIWYFDMLMHFLGGFWVGLAYFYLFSTKGKPFDFTQTTYTAIIAVLLVGLSWEIFEFLVDKTIAQNGFNFLDTTSDLLFDLAGGGTAVFYFFKRIMLSRENKVE